MATQKMDSVFTLNPEQGKRAMALCWMAEKLMKKAGTTLTCPVVMVGATSTAKTATARAFVDMLNGMQEDKSKYKLWLEHVSYYADAGDIGGIPFPKDSVMAYLMNENLPFNCEDHGVVVMDEMDRVRDESIQNSLLQVLNGREIHGHKLSPNVFVIGTMNGTSDAGTLPLCEAFKGRVCTLFFSSRASGMVDSYEGWANNHGISNIGKTFSRYRRELLRADSEFEEIAVPVQRTVDMADFVLQASKLAKFGTDDILLPVIAGLVGKRVATEFIATERLINEAPSITEILAHPDTAEVPQNQSVCYALASALSDYAKTGKREELAKLAEYIARLSPEFGAMSFKRMSKDAPAVVTTKPFQAWAKEHKALLI